MKKNLIPAILLMLLLAAPGYAIVQVIPPLQEIEGIRGRTAEFKFTVSNIGDDPMPGVFNVYDMDVSQDGLPMVADTTADSSGTKERYDRGCAKWVTLTPSEVTIPAHGTVDLMGELHVPKDADGSYYAMFRGHFSESAISLQDTQGKLRDTGINLENQVAFVLMVTVRSSKNRAIIMPDTLLLFPQGKDETAELSLGTDNSGAWEAILPLRNSGNVHTRVSGTVSFWTESGVRIESASWRAGKGYIMPGKVRNFYAKGVDRLNDGYYLIRLNLQTAEGRNLTDTFPFAIYEGKVYPGAMTDELGELLHAASPGFRLKNGYIERKVTPGGMSYLVVNLQNMTTDTLHLVPRLVDWGIDPNGLPVFAENGELQSRSCNNWFTLESKVLEVLPSKNASYKIQVHTPDKIAGEYYAAMVFDSDRPRPDLPKEFLSGRTQLISLSCPMGMDYEVAIDTVTFKQEMVGDRSMYRFNFGVSNHGNTHCYALGQFSLEHEVAPGVYEMVGGRNEFGHREAMILPEGKRDFELLTQDLEAGKYRAIVSVAYADDEQPSIRFQPFTIQ